MIPNYPGNKKRLSKKILKYIPEDFSTYVEPFSGSFFVYFSLPLNLISNKNIIYNDLNSDLVKLFREIRFLDFNFKESASIKYLYNLLGSEKNIKRFKEFIDVYIPNIDKIDVFENMDYKEVIKKYDSIDTFFYLDPPYFNKEFKYNYTIDHIELANILKKLKGRFVLSYSYFDGLYDLYEGFKIINIDNGYQKEYLVMN